MEGEGISVALTPPASLLHSSCTVQRVRTIAYARCRHCAHRRGSVTAPIRIPTVFCIQTSIRSVSASEKVYWVQIFQGKSECLLEQKAKGRGEWKWCEERKEEDAGDSGVHKMCQKKILLLFLPPRPLYKYIYISFFGKFVFKLWLLFPSNIMSIRGKDQCSTFCVSDKETQHAHAKFLLHQVLHFISQCRSQRCQAWTRVAALCPPTMHLAAMLSCFGLTACQSVALSANTKYV